MNKATAWLKKSLDFEFSDPELLRRALTHRSASGPNNERLEFLGDSVLQLVVSDLVFNDRPDASEGRLSRLRSSLVKDTMLADVANALGIGEHIVLGPGEKKSGGHRRPSILADALEAVFGAVYLDAGYAAARQVIHTAYGDRFRDLPVARRDPKSKLQEWLQGRGHALPEYEVDTISGKAHQQSFTVHCRIAEFDLLTRGRGSSRRSAEQEAALNMLARLEGGESR